MPQSNIIAVIGAGTWGITLACLLAEKGHKVRVWDVDRNWLKRLEIERRHFRLPELILPEEVQINYELKEALEYADYVVLVVP
ncbi:MAG: 3-hydroxyacyl-CoA dehydrogenase NAD-binding domain-containing protein, partial [Candidatus Sumerlaeia bacterium]|nr:3-hydroxyacyl-CoA dehydrogenase NAD-binding domain-containing protein [Candidatus Sumerlaeia bacterium]